MTRSGVVALIVTSLAVAGCGSAEPAPSPQLTEATSAVSPAASELEGTWRTAPISVEQTTATIRRHGLGRWVREYARNAPFTGDTVLSLTIEDGAWNLYGESAGRDPEPIDYDAEYDIDGDVVVFHHSDGSNTYRWAVEDDTLRLRFVGSTLPDYRGIPDEVFQRALYTTASFTRE